MNNAQRKVVEDRIELLKHQAARINKEIAELHEGIAGSSTITLGAKPETYEEYKAAKNRVRIY